ncbi:MAG: IS30 family transposase [Actinobacteria bacterium HGW-Actinobacteria-10]|nr:MAG: IS30 family transposase [Actinobacteria bacterium HGW-Actinobacteria-10]
MYAQITLEERYAIAALKKQKLSIRAIAAALERSPSTVSREIRRNRVPACYSAFKADQRTRARRSRSRKGNRIPARTWREVERLLRQQWSPEQIAGTLKANGARPISHETIYVHIWRDKRRGGSLWTHLRQAGKKRRKRYGAYDSRGRLAGKRHISERPAEVETRDVVGHWEIDTVVGTDRGRHSVVTMVERATGFTVMGKLERHTAGQCAEKVIELIARHEGRVLTITADNGTEFHNYRDVELATGVLFYFATPHHSWERGTNENTNGLIRQSLPKRTSLCNVTQGDCDVIAAKLNSRPRKRLGYKTPEECYVQAW